ALVASDAPAENLGTMGPTYPIAEQHLLDQIMTRLREKERSGELARQQQLARTRAIQAVTNPKPVAGLQRVEAARTFYFDPSFTLEENVVDGTGALLFQVATRT